MVAAGKLPPKPGSVHEMPPTHITAKPKARPSMRNKRTGVAEKLRAPEGRPTLGLGSLGGAFENATTRNKSHLAPPKDRVASK